MPSSLRFVLLLFGLGVAAALTSIFVVPAIDMRQARINAEQMTGGNADRGRAAIDRFGCGACHIITGIAGADGQVGPSLSDIASRTEIAGHLPNQPSSMIRWLRYPQAVAPGNGMPDQGIGEGDARDIAAYLYTLRRRSG
jgi:cytochrome c2